MKRDILRCFSGVKIKQNKQRGFTLIELLVVISIISLLASVILSALNSARVKARDAARTRTVEEYKKAIYMAYDANGGVYPTPAVGTYYCVGDGDGDGNCGKNNANSQDSTVNDQIKKFLPSLPTVSKAVYSGSDFIEGIYYCNILSFLGCSSDFTIYWALENDTSCPGGTQKLGTLCEYNFE